MVIEPAISLIALVQASVLVPSMFIAQEPQMPSRQERRKASVASISFLILMIASRTIGPHSERFTDRCPYAGSGHRPATSDRRGTRCQSPLPLRGAVFQVLPLDDLGVPGKGKLNHVVPHSAGCAVRHERDRESGNRFSRKLARPTQRLRTAIYRGAETARSSPTSLPAKW